VGVLPGNTPSRFFKSESAASRPPSLQNSALLEGGAGVWHLLPLM
jgi:hypothetical protein